VQTLHIVLAWLPWVHRADIIAHRMRLIMGPGGPRWIHGATQDATLGLSINLSNDDPDVRRARSSGRAKVEVRPTEHPRASHRGGRHITGR
jgi:hypothetical protein